MTTIGILGFGEVGACFGAALARAGAEVRTYDVRLASHEGTRALEARRGDAPVRFCDLPTLVDRSELLLSTVTTDVALEAAQRCGNHLGPDRIFADLNATAPAAKRAIADTVEATGADFVEGAILGAVGVSGAATRILTGGPKGAVVADLLTGLGLNADFYDAEIGKASAFKMLRSVFSKGLEALLLESLVAGRRAGVEDDLWQEMIETLEQSRFRDVAGNWIRTHATAYERRCHEMVQVQELVTELGLEPIMTRATHGFFERSTRLGLVEVFSEPLESPGEVIALLDARLRSESDRHGETSA